VFLGSYKFTGGPLKGLTAGLAVNYNDAYPTNNTSLANSLRLTSEIALVDIFFNHESKFMGRAVSYNLKVTNVLNERIYADFNGTWGNPLAAQATVRFKF
jgi:hypothetical protein